MNKLYYTSCESLIGILCHKFAICGYRTIVNYCKIVKAYVEENANIEYCGLRCMLLYRFVAREQGHFSL